MKKKIYKLLCCALFFSFVISPITTFADTGLQTPTGIVSGNIQYKDDFANITSLNDLKKISIDTNDIDIYNMNLTNNIYHKNWSCTLDGKVYNFDDFYKVLYFKFGDSDFDELIKTYAVSSFKNGSFMTNSTSEISVFNADYYYYIKHENDNTNVSNKKSYKRLSGANRIATSLAIANEYSSSQLQNVILATSNDFPDALSGSVLSKKYNAPLLLYSNNNSDNTNVINYIKSHLVSGGNIYVLGGTGVITDSSLNVFSEYKITRLSGVNRLGTNSKIINQLGAAQGTPVVVATANDFPDALSISSVAAINGFPILLTNKDSLGSDAMNILSSMKPSKVYIVGGTGVVSSNVQSQLSKYTSNIKRLSGNDRFDTSLSVANEFKLTSSNAVIATGMDFPDALSGSSIAVKYNAPIILVDSRDTSKQKQYLDSTNITNLYVLGGTGVVSDTSINNLLK